MRCVSLFSGAGGFDVGLRAAGFEISKSIDVDRDSCETLRQNGQIDAVCANLLNISDFDFLSEQSFDLLAGGPPCQPFSKSALWTNKGATGFEDERSKTIDVYFRFVERLRPRAFIFENVQGFASHGGINIILNKLQHLRKSGLTYNLSYKIIDAAHFGVPQHRRRFFAVGMYGRPSFQFPDATHGLARHPLLNAWDACEDANHYEYEESLHLKGKWADLIHSIPAGHNYLYHTNRGAGMPLFGWRTKYWSFLHKIDPLKPSPTITANPAQNCGPFHWENRQFSTQELARIQTFPDTYRFAGDQSSRRRQIGNAVPPLLAEILGRSLLDQLGCKQTSNIQLLPKRATSQPQHQKVLEVPAKYHKYCGLHADHPGAGLGPKPRAVLHSMQKLE